MPAFGARQEGRGLRVRLVRWPAEGATAPGRRRFAGWLAALRPTTSCTPTLPCCPPSYPATPRPCHPQQRWSPGSWRSWARGPTCTRGTRRGWNRAGALLTCALRRRPVRLPLPEFAPFRSSLTPALLPPLLCSLPAKPRRRCFRKLGCCACTTCNCLCLNFWCGAWRPGPPRACRAAPAARARRCLRTLQQAGDPPLLY